MKVIKIFSACLFLLPFVDVELVVLADGISELIEPRRTRFFRGGAQLF